MKAERPDTRKLKALKRGHIAEYRAALCLMLKGYRIVAMRYRTRLGEIDIIARRGDLVACVEVKARVSLRMRSSPSQTRRNGASGRQAISGCRARAISTACRCATISSP